MDKGLCGRETCEQKPEGTKQTHTQIPKGKPLWAEQVPRHGVRAALGKFAEQQGDQRGDKSEGNYQRPQGTRAGARTAPRRELFFMFLKGYQEECVRAQVWPTQLRTSAVGPSYRKSV